jgi:hypothetical protein
MKIKNENGGNTVGNFNIKTRCMGRRVLVHAEVAGARVRMRKNR